MTYLSVNVNKLATLRNARGKNNPDVLQTTLKIIEYGAHGITVHPRPDERHIRKSDVYAIAEAISVEFNIEGYPDKDFLRLIADVKPAQCTLVPDPPDVLTSNAGWKVHDNLSFLQDTIAFLHDHGVRTSLFIDPNHFQVTDYNSLSKTNTDRVELYTEQYAVDFHTVKKDSTLAIYKDAAQQINAMGIDINAGHDLNLNNLYNLVQAIPSIQEVSIGHALICDSLEYGLKDVIAKYLDCLNLKN